MKYKNKTFSVAVGESQKYRDNWEAAFGSQDTADEPRKELYPVEPEFYDTLRAEFPAMYASVYCGFDCPPGWEPLVYALSKTINNYPWGKWVRCVQVKQKFGGLRWYWDMDDEALSGYEQASEVVRAAEWASWLICEECGTTRDVETAGGWLRTLCARCAGWLP